MDSDSIFYGIFVVAGIIFSVLDSKRKAKQKKESSRPTSRPIQPPPMPGAGSSTKREDEDDWWHNDEDNGNWQDKDDDNWEEETIPPLPHRQEASIFDQLKEIIKKDVQQQFPPHSSTPSLKKAWKSEKLSAQKQNRSITFETPKMEGQRVTSDSPIAGVDEAYSQTNNLPANNSEWRKAIIAHEILKRKF